MKLKFITGLLLLTKITFAQVPTTWTVNPADFTNQMYITAKANVACVDLVNANNYVAAFVGTQCRGIVQTSVVAGTNYLGNLTVNSNVASGEKVKFQIYNSATNQIINVLDSIVFSQNTTLGNPLMPFVLYSNHSPTNIAISNYTIAENTVLATTIATLTASDQDGTTTFNYSLTATQPENTQFTITGNLLQVNSIYDYETDSIKVIEIAVNDNGGCGFVKTFTIHVTNVNDAPIALTHTVSTIFDNQQANSYMGRFFTTDPDLNDVHTYSLVTGVGSTDNNQFYVQHDTLYNVSTIAYATQSTYYIRARTTDLGGLFFENTFTLTVSNVNDAPSDISLNTFTVNENMPIGTAIATMTVTDADPGDTHTLTLVSGSGSVDNASVTIVGNVLQTNAILNFEQQNTLQVRIMATDLAGATFVKNFTLTINDVNDAPTNILLPSDSVYELQPLATLVGTLSSIDEDATGTHSYSLVTGLGDTDNGLFAINSNSLVSNASYTFTNQFYSIRLRTTDNGGLTFEKVLSIKILNVNQAPTDIIIDSTWVLEDNNAMQYISKIKSADFDNPDSWTYSLIAGTNDSDNGEFTITGDNLFINEKTNYDVKEIYHIRVKSTDADGLSFEKAFDISVRDIVGNSIPLPSTNYLSPNGDTKNDLWKIDNVEIYTDYALKIFDQFGQVIYSVPNNYKNDWDGKYNGKALPTGNYYFEFKNSKKTYTGNITIMN